MRFLPCVDGSELARTFFTPAGWSVQPCVRPFGAVHMTAGHNALRGSGPGQNRAFRDAVALMGCPDRQIDRLLHITPDDTQRDLCYAASATGSLWQQEIDECAAGSPAIRPVPMPSGV